MKIIEFKSGWQWIMVYKAGCTLLKNIQHYELYNSFFDKDHNFGKVTQIHNSVLNHNIKTFFVWRDPYDRITSLYKDILSHDYGQDSILEGLKKYGINRNNIQDKKDEFIEFCLNNINNDVHLDKISYTIPEDIILNHVDYIVYIDRLSEFVEDKLGYNISDIKFRNVSKNIDVSYFEKYRNKIKELYKEDYDIINKYKYKLY